ncbi:MAG: helix-turn-helix domain-containing protein [Nitrosospira sp.]|nr:helix-turn-helix domain-containing protein [Nitrosospira sp.]
MNSHKNARLTRLGRVHLMHQIAHMGLKAAARQAGVSRRCAYIWRKRWGESGAEGLYDRSSRLL